MKYKFKYFFDSRGVAPEDEINKWLEEHRNIEIKHIYGQSDTVYIFYVEEKRK